MACASTLIASNNPGTDRHTGSGLTLQPRVAIIGAGAAGSMAAIFAARHGAEVVLLERTQDGGRKILISGGGRCNVLPARLDETRFVTDSSPNLLRKIVRSWPLGEQVAFFETDLGIPLAEQTGTAKLFPVSNKARDVRDTLLAHARSAGADIRMDAHVTGLAPHDGGWRITLALGAPLDVQRVVVASGGLSVPNTGSDGFGLRALSELGHTIHPTYAALTPLTAKPAPFASLAGVSLLVTITARSPTRSATASGGFVFTHQGYSGPAVLDVSHVAVRSLLEKGANARITVQWSKLQDADWEEALKPSGPKTIGAAVRSEMPERLATALIAAAHLDSQRPLADLRRDDRLRLIQMLVRGELPWTGDEGYKKAEVTGGGVSLAEIDPRTMESRKQPNLFICGEVLDAFGPIGGYNFLWSWATGKAAGIAAASPEAT